MNHQQQYRRDSKHAVCTRLATSYFNVLARGRISSVGACVRPRSGPIKCAKGTSSGSPSMYHGIRDPPILASSYPALRRMTRAYHYSSLILAYTILSRPPLYSATCQRSCGTLLRPQAQSLGQSHWRVSEPPCIEAFIRSSIFKHTPWPLTEKNVLCLKKKKKNNSYSFLSTFRAKNPCQADIPPNLSRGRLRLTSWVLSLVNMVHKDPKRPTTVGSDKIKHYRGKYRLTVKKKWSTYASVLLTSQNLWNWV